MNRKKKLLLNTFTAIIQQIVTLVCGFILPRLIISHYGSATNGLISSITQFLAFFSMMEMGVGAVVRSSLYKPLADHDHDQISRVLISSRNFFRKIGTMLCIYTVADCRQRGYLAIMPGTLFPVVPIFHKSNGIIVKNP